MNPFEEFLRGSIAPCVRCGQLCAIGDVPDEEARLLQKETDPARGLCPDCAVTSWFKASPFGALIENEPEKLLWPPIQEKFAEVMLAGKSQMRPEDIAWERVVQNWRLSFSESKGERKRGRR